ncbi:MAG: ATP synthase F1 subunit delta [Candidatus Paracaedibacteraceae bacterium]|nr:ATP synthase F1 subunit delta [Candidatus Paracaedibacteraceae bacterium]
MDTALLKGLQTSIPGRYARALFEVAQEQKQTSAILRQLKEFNNACESDSSIQKSLPYFKESDFTDFVSSLACKLDWPKYLVHFFQILYHAKRLSFFGQITEIFENCCNHADNVLNAVIKTPTMPTQSQKTRIQAQVVSIFGKKINYEYESIPDLLGGVLVQVDNLQIDASLKTQINTLKKTLHDIPLKGAA